MYLLYAGSRHKQRFYFSLSFLYGALFLLLMVGNTSAGVSDELRVLREDLEPAAEEEAAGAVAPHRRIDGEGGHLHAIPPNHPQDNSIDLALHFFAEEEDTVVDLSVRMRGAYNHRFKSRYRHNPEYKQDIARLFQTMYAKGELESLNVKGVDDTSDFAATARIRFSGTGINHRKKLVMSGALQQPLNAFSNLPELDKPEERTQDYDFGFGYRLNMHVHAESPGAHYRPIPLSGSDRASTDYFEYWQESSVQPSGSFGTQMSFFLKEPLIPQEHYARFYQDLQALLKRAEWGVLYKQDNIFNRQASVESMAEWPTGDAVALLKLAHQYLAQAAYEDARKAAEAALKSAPANGEAYYVLGIALGFLDEFKASDRALSIAKILGYQP